MNADFSDSIQYIRSNIFGGNMNAGQVVGVQMTLNEWINRQYTDLRWLAYMLATQKWETAHTMLPVRETLASSDVQARNRLANVWYAVPDANGNSYYGRGLVQLTHKQNYAAMTKILGERFGVDLVKDPDKALEPNVATAIMFEGMTRAESGVGDFTGLALEDFFGPNKEKWVRARQVINGLDHAGDIADIARQFYAALTGSPSPRRLLMFGASGPAVVALQTALHDAGYYEEEIDGDFGPLTKAAVVAFQSANNLDPDGIVGDVTRTALGI